MYPKLIQEAVYLYLEGYGPLLFRGKYCSGRLFEGKKRRGFEEMRWIAESLNLLDIWGRLVQNTPWSGLLALLFT